jgi:nicotinamidase-related amidase
MSEAYVSALTLKAKARKWLAEIAPFNEHKMALQAREAALIVIDMQRYFAHPDGAAYLHSAHAILGNIKLLIAAFRGARRPVIYTRHAHRPGSHDAGILGRWWGDLIVDGTPDSRIHSALAPRKSDKVVVKNRYSAFYGTNLETVLRSLRIKTLVISGVMTNLCCESTARDAYYRDYSTIFLADATGTQTEDMHRATLLNLAYGFSYVTTTEDVLSQLAFPRVR